MTKRKNRRGPITTTLEIAIVTAPQHHSGIVSLQDEARLVKSALLYADTVELVSHSALLIADFQAAANVGEETVIEFFATRSDATLRSLGLDPDLTRIFSGLSPQAVKLRRQLLGGRAERNVRRNTKQLYELIDQMAALAPGQQVADLSARAGAAELEEAIDLGLLRYAPRGERFSGDFDSNEDYLPTLRDFLSDPNTHVMFDRTMSDLIRGLESQGRVMPHPTAVRHTSEAGVGTDLIRHMPVFPDARLTDLLAARKDLAEPLQAYRSGVAELSAALPHGPFHDENELELSELWEHTVVPRINELKRALRLSRLAKESAVATVGRTGNVLGSGAVAAMTMNAANLGPIVDVAAGLIGSAVAATASVAQSRLKINQDVAKDQMYYLLELDRRT